MTSKPNNQMILGEQGTLFDAPVEPVDAAPVDDEPDASAPLATRMRPRTLDEVAGQQHLIGPGKVLRRMIEADTVPSMVFWGPPGVGKTTLARFIAHQTRAAFIDFSAVTSGIKEIREVMRRAEAQTQLGRRTILFVDEIHRFNKAQQDAFLPYVEKGAITLIGATTENPSFEVNGALLSRCKVFVLKALTVEEMVGLLRRALDDPRGFGEMDVRTEDDLLTARVGELGRPEKVVPQQRREPLRGHAVGPPEPQQPERDTRAHDGQARVGDRDSEAPVTERGGSHARGEPERHAAERAQAELADDLLSVLAYVLLHGD